jgi:sporulation protein YlmC with PRC-barrel domain
VVTSDGHRVGWIADLVAEPLDGKLGVTALLVGPSGLIERVLVAGKPTGEIPWTLVDRVDQDVHLRVTRAELAIERFKVAEKSST